MSIKKPFFRNYCVGGMGPRLVVRTGSACNGTCFFCIGANNKKINFPDCDSLIRLAAEQKDYKHVLILGGEPLIYPNIQKLIKGLYDNGKIISITTNGCKLDLLKPVIQYIDKIIVSIHHYDMNINKKIIGIDVQNIDTNIHIFNELNPNCKLRTNCVMLKGYIDTYDKMKIYAETMKNYGFTSIKFSEFVTHNLYDPYYVDIQSLLKNKGISQKDPYISGCYITPENISYEFGIKTIFNFACIAKCPIKIFYNDISDNEIFENLNKICPDSKVINGLTIGDDFE